MSGTIAHYAIDAVLSGKWSSWDEVEYGIRGWKDAGESIPKALGFTATFFRDALPSLYKKFELVGTEINVNYRPSPGVLYTGTIDGLLRERGAPLNQLTLLELKTTSGYLPSEPDPLRLRRDPQIQRYAHLVESQGLAPAGIAPAGIAPAGIALVVKAAVGIRMAYPNTRNHEKIRAQTTETALSESSITGKALSDAASVERIKELTDRARSKSSLKALFTILPAFAPSFNGQDCLCDYKDVCGKDDPAIPRGWKGPRSRGIVGVPLNLEREGDGWPFGIKRVLALVMGAELFLSSLCEEESLMKQPAKGPSSITSKVGCVVRGCS